jgi:hypothetical protein
LTSTARINASQVTSLADPVLPKEITPPSEVEKIPKQDVPRGDPEKVLLQIISLIEDLF